MSKIIIFAEYGEPEALQVIKRVFDKYFGWSNVSDFNLVIGNWYLEPWIPPGKEFWNLNTIEKVDLMMKCSLCQINIIFDRGYFTNREIDENLNKVPDMERKIIKNHPMVAEIFILNTTNEERKGIRAIERLVESLCKNILICKKVYNI